MASTRIAEVPDQSFYDRYVGRKITPDFSDFDIMDTAYEHGENVLIEGPTGPGKTSMVLAWAAYREQPFYAVPCNQSLDPSQLFGKYIPDGKGGFVWQDGPVTDLVRHGGVLLFNEVNFMPERIAAVTYGLLDVQRRIVLMDHKAEVIRPADLLIVADMNPEYEGTRPLNKAFRNRFAHQLDWGYSDVVEKRLVKSATLLKLANDIREDGSVDTPVSTNMLQEFERFALRLDVEYALSNFQAHFTSDERAIIKIVVDTVKGNLKTDFRKMREELAEQADSGVKRKPIRKRRPATPDANSALSFVQAQRPH